jgi:hypothetical protein
VNSQAVFIRLIALYPDSDALDDNDDDSGDGNDDKSYDKDAQDVDDVDDVDDVNKVLFVEVLFAEVPFLAFADKYILESLYNSLHLDYSILCVC